MPEPRSPGSSVEARPLAPSLVRRRDAFIPPAVREPMDALLRASVDARDWYHSMDLGSGIVTPGFGFGELWENVRRVRASIGYAGKSVLDLGCYDGMWAFEAEALDAALVVAVDCCESWRTPEYDRLPQRGGDRHRPRYQGHENFSLVREALRSDVVAYFNVPMTDLVRRLDGVLGSHPLAVDGFDIVQHLGVLYHVRDPMLTLAQTRSVMKDGGTLLLETGIYNASNECALFFNRDFSALFDDPTTWWLPTLEGLGQMLEHSLFDVDEGSIVRLPRCGAETHDRIALRAVARRGSTSVNERYYLDAGFGHGFDPALFKQTHRR